jgi:hypothetical protein
MAESVTCNVNANITALLTSPVGQFGPAQFNPALTAFMNIVLSSGSGAPAKVNQLYCVSGTIAASGNVVIDLLSLTDQIGNALAFGTVKVFGVQNTGNSTPLGSGPGTNPVEADILGVGGAASQAWIGAFTGTLTVPSPSSLGAQIPAWIAAAPGQTSFPVVSGSSHNLKLTNASSVNPIGYNLVIAGASS